MRIEEHVELKRFTTMGVGGAARYFATVTTTEELQKVLQFIRDKQLSFFVLGGGSNIVFSDDGYDGVVIKMEIKDISYTDTDDGVVVRAGAGVVWDELVEETVSKDVYGFENLSLIPGTVGASAVQNIGAYGVEVETFIQLVEAIDSETGILKTFTHDVCNFGYRESIFKTTEGKKYVITHVTYVLQKNSFNVRALDRLQKKLEEKNITSPTAKDVRDAVVEMRKAKLPYGGDVGSAGSFFKNPVIPKRMYEELLATYPTMLKFETGREDVVKVPAGWIIDNVCHARGLTEGSVGTYKHQALVIVNHGGATAREVKKFAEKIVTCVKEKTGINLEREVEYVAS